MENYCEYLYQMQILMQNLAHSFETSDPPDGSNSDAMVPFVSGGLVAFVALSIFHYYQRWQRHNNECMVESDMKKRIQL